MGKQHRILKKNRLIRDFRWNAKELQSYFGEDLETLTLKNTGWKLKDVQTNAEPLAVAFLVPRLEEIGFYRLCTFHRLLEETVQHRKKEKEQLIRGVVSQAGRLGLSSSQLFNRVSSQFPCTSRETFCCEHGHVHLRDLSSTDPFRFLESLFPKQLTS